MKKITFAKYYGEKRRRKISQISGETWQKKLYSDVGRMPD
jgi:hypothetical protein